MQSGLEMDRGDIGWEIKRKRRRGQRLRELER
jgi:hypothetical protein